jgi:hypothetical protein
VLCGRKEQRQEHPGSTEPLIHIELVQEVMRYSRYSIATRLLHSRDARA